MAAAEGESTMTFAEFGRTRAAPLFGAYVDTARFLELETAEARQLLGDLPPAEYDRLVRDGATELSEAIVERMGVVFKIVARLRQLFAHDETGRRWLHGRNTDFSGETPLSVMLRGLPELYSVLDYLDGWAEPSFT